MLTQLEKLPATCPRATRAERIHESSRVKQALDRVLKPFEWLDVGCGSFEATKAWLLFLVMSSGKQPGEE